MYELPPDRHLAFLVGCEVQQIRLGLFQTIIMFDRDVAIEIGAEFTLDGSRLPAPQGHVLRVLLGKVVTAVRRVSSVALGLHSSGTTLSCMAWTTVTSRTTSRARVTSSLFSRREFLGDSPTMWSAH
jgi:hypothetical protein